VVLIPLGLVLPGDGTAGRLAGPAREVTAPRFPVREVTPPAAAREVTLPPAVAGPVTVPLPPAAVPSDGNGTRAGAPSPSDVTAPEDLQLEPQPVGAQTGLTEHGLPQRVRQMSLAPPLRDS